MRYLIPASLALTASLALSVPASAADYTLPTKREMQTYSALWHTVRHVHGARTPGRNIRRHGVRTERGHVRAASATEVSRSIRTFRRWLAPPSPSSRPGDRISARPAYAGGRWAIPADIVMCESGGNYRAVNHGGSGAGGAYQIMPSTWAAHGGHGLPQDAPPAEQDRIAALIWAGGAGRGQWAC